MHKKLLNYFALSQTMQKRFTAKHRKPWTSGKKLHCAVMRPFIGWSRLQRHRWSLWFSCISALVDLPSVNIVYIPEESKVLHIFEVWGIITDTIQASEKDSKLFPGLCFLLLKKRTWYRNVIFLTLTKVVL